MNFDLLVPIHTQSHHLPIQESWSIHVIHKLPDDTPTMSAANFKLYINFYFNPGSLPESTSGNLTRPPLPLLPFFPSSGTC